MKQLYLLFLFLIFPFFHSQGQIAQGGSSKNYDKVYWLTWDEDNLQDQWEGKLQERMYEWKFAEDIRIRATVSDLSTDEDDGQVLAYTPGTWRGDGLGCLYSGAAGDGSCDDGVVLGVKNSALVNDIDGDKITFSIDIELGFKIEGDWRTVPYPGMVIADAEELNGAGEFISAEIKNSGTDTQWQLIDKRETGNGSSNYKVTFGKKEGEGGNQTVRFEAEGGVIGNQAVFFARGATGFQDVTLQGGGKTALALGFVLPFDISTAEDYCEVRHYIDDFKPIQQENDECSNLNCMEETDLNPIPTVFIGSPDNPLDNNSIHPDDLQINFTQNIISIEVQVTNTKNEPATLYWWMDFNDDKIFSDDEVKVFENIAPGETSKRVRLEFTEEDFPGEYIGRNLRVGDLHSRLRITTTVLRDDSITSQDERSCALAIDGEVEDYIFDVRGISISGEVFIDADGMSDNEVDGMFGDEKINFESNFANPLYAYLLQDGTHSIAGKTSILPDGTYNITNMNHGNYSLVLSYEVYEVETIFPFGAHTQLPASWKVTGETLGINNASVPENLLDDVIDGSVPIETPAAGWDITQVNFGINQPPEVADLTYTIEAYGFIEAPVLTHAVDHQAYESIVAGSLSLIDAGGNRQSTLILDGVGTFIVTGEYEISFSPVQDFHGNTVSIQYVVEDAAELVSLPGLLTVEVEQPQFIMVNPVLPSKLRG